MLLFRFGSAFCAARAVTSLRNWTLGIYLVPIRSYRVIDMRQPQLWYPSARRIKRNIIAHIGPTNSGKTHSALESLKASIRGVYCGPLRLLAWEVHKTLREGGILCSLVTGQELALEDNSTHTSCTVEMCDISAKYDCAVIDEFQLIGDEDRGWAWSRAFLGLQANEIHVCGNNGIFVFDLFSGITLQQNHDLANYNSYYLILIGCPSFLKLVKEMCKLCGDDLEVKTYERLRPLELSENALNSLRNIRHGDCLVAFSRRQIYDFKSTLEAMHPKLKCFVV
jgi:ATP-dependent RNA helicase SUPV3L1/SUV3